MIDVASYMEGQGAVRSHGASGAQYTLPCPFCGKVGTFYVAGERRMRRTDRDGNERWTEVGDWICFAGRCEKKGRFADLYAQLEGIDRKAARIELARGALGDRGSGPPRPPAPPPKPVRVAARATPVAAAPAPEVEPEAPPEPAKPVRLAPSGEPMVDTPLPPEFIPCWTPERWRIPSYLTERGVTREAIKTFGLGFCTSGRYSNRIVVPVSCPEGRSFQTRAIDRENKLRYLSGEGCGRLLFGWERAKNAGVVVICEGPFDALAIHMAGLPVIATLGKRLKANQAAMIASLPARKLVYMLDPDALDDALQQAPRFGTRLLVAGDLGWGDPAEAIEEAGMEAGKAAILAAVRTATPWEAAKNSRIVEKAQALRKRLGG